MDPLAIIIGILALIIYALYTMASFVMQKFGGSEATSLIKYFDQITNRAQYKKQQLNSVHNGQVKLFLSELEFLTECLGSANEPALFIYAGSAPSNKLSYLSELFPGAKFLLVDPNEHYIMFGEADQYDPAHMDKFLYFRANPADGSSPGRKMRLSSNAATQRVNLHNEGHVERLPTTRRGEVPADIAEIISNTNHTFYIIEDLFTNELADLLKDIPIKYFISDIRTGEGSVIDDIDIVWNSALMYNWINILKPNKFMLKFRTPWTITARSIAKFNAAIKPHHMGTFAECSIPFVDNFNKSEFHFVKPDHIYMQAFAPPQSAETRLIGSEISPYKFDVAEYEEKLAWFNQDYRVNNHLDMKYTSDELASVGLNDLHDSALALDIFQTYIDKYEAKLDALEMFKRLLSIIHRTVEGYNPD